jgi:hypothetical protein
MKLLPGLLCAVALAFAADESASLQRARQEFDRVRALVDAGAFPKSKLAEAQADLDDAIDEAVLERTLYGKIAIEDLSERQADDMLAAANRRLERQRARIDRQRKLIDLGVVARADLGDLETDLEHRRSAVTQAESRSALLREIVEVARAEAAAAAEAREAVPKPEWKAKEFVNGDHLLAAKDLKALMLGFEKEFGRPLPISARGSTAVHRALGLDHSGRIDVALAPDSPEGIWLRKFLDDLSVPYYAFRIAIPGKATAPHIHIGPGSTRIIKPSA